MIAAPRQRLRRRDRLRKRRDYERVSREGMRVSTQCFLMLVADRFPASDQSSSPRLGLTVSRRVGGSVVRSRVKRHIREWFRRARCVLPERRDVVVIARPAAAALSHDGIARELAEAADRLRSRIGNPQARPTR